MSASETIHSPSRTPGMAIERGGALTLLVAALGLAAAAWYFFTRPAPLDHSILGMKGFVHFANAQPDAKKTKRRFRFHEGPYRPDASKTGLRVLPLYDIDIFGLRGSSTKNKQDEQRILRRLPRYAYRSKIAHIPTLVVLPKWRREALVGERLHPDFLIGSSEIRLPYKDSGKIGSPEVRRGPAEFTTPDVKRAADLPSFNPGTTGKPALYAMQTISTATTQTGCKPLLLANEKTLLAHCPLGQTDTWFWMLTDPDLLNNHGAGNAGNAQFMLDLLLALAGPGEIVFDATTTVRRPPSERTQTPTIRERNISDLLRFFAYPFSLFWILLGGLAVLTMWHASRRYGAALDDAGETLLIANKATVINADVALLRSGAATDRLLARRRIEQQINRLASDILGGGRKRGSEGLDQLVASVARRNHTLGAQLSNFRKSLDDTTPAPHAGRGSLLDHLKQFENLIRDIRHEFGRTTDPRN